MHNFCQYSFSLRVSDLKFNKRKFPGQILASWNLNFNHKDGDPLIGPGVAGETGLLHFDKELQLTTKLVYNKQEEVFHPKKSVLHFLHIDHYEQGKINKFTNLGVVSIDLAGCTNPGRQRDTQVFSLEKCSDKTAKVMLSVGVSKEKDVENLDRSLEASIDSKGSRARKESSVTRQKSKEKIEELTDEILKTAVKAKKSEALSKTVDRPSKFQSSNVSEVESIDNPLSKYVSQFRSQNQINLDRQIQMEKETNLMLSTKVTQLEDIIRQSMSDITNQTITQLQEALSQSKTNLQYLNKQLKEANDEISKLTNKVEVLYLENKQLKSEVETIRSTKKVRFNLEQETRIEDLKEEMKRFQITNVELQAKLFLQTEDSESLKLENQSLMEQIELLAQEVDNQKRNSDFHRVKFEQFQLKSQRKKKEKSKKYREKMLFLSNQVMRLHAELYELRTDNHQQSNKELLEENEELRRFCSQKKRYESMKDMVLKLSRDKPIDDEVLKTVRSKSKQMKKKYNSIHQMDEKRKDLRASVTQIKALNTKLGAVNDKKLATCLREMENKIEDLLEIPVEKS